jgi:hypothetical protein
MSFANNLVHYGDMLAIPFFFITFIYFYKIDNKTLLEILIMVFAVVGFLFDALATIIYKLKLKA